MAKIICAYSSLELSVSHFPMYLDQRECYHPIFTMKNRNLYSYYLSHYVQGKLDSTESYLLFLALLHSSELVEFRTAAIRTEQTDALIAQYLPDLFRVVNLISGIKHPSFSIPNLAITHDTRDLNNVKSWIRIWNEAYADFISGLAKSELKEKLSRRESGLEKLIKSPQISPEKYAPMLAAWASEAGAFPEFSILYEDGTEGTCAAYWRDIIVRCYKTENILAIPPKDLQELIDHCQENIDAGSIFSHALYAALEEGKSRQKNFFGIGDLISLSSENPGFRIIDIDNPRSIEDANIAVLIDTAPAFKPVRKDYVSDFQYLKAKSKYELSLQYRKESKITTDVIELNGGI